MKKLEKIHVLDVVYGIAVLVCLGLTFAGAVVDAASIVINVALFIIVFVIFFNARKAIQNIVDITKDLKRVTEKIKEESESLQENLWDRYSCDNAESLFENKELIRVYQDYVKERKKLAIISENYKSDISDYINEAFIDSLMKKNVYNLVPGVLTGLGILGTFIGLSLGLQEFNTGSAQEIEKSIAPLMQGIKVAFHTSIYGMWFSLWFNFIYKETLEDAYIAVDAFLEVFDKYVDSNASNNNEIIVQTLLEKMPEAIGRTIVMSVSPVIEKMNITLDNLAKNISTTQMEGVAEIVDHFISAMDSSMGDSFKALGETIDKTIEQQIENGKVMDNVLNEVKEMTNNIMDINEVSNKTISHVSGYVEKLDAFQGVLNDNFVSIKTQLEYQKEYEDKLREYVDILVNYERQIGEASNRFTEDMCKQLEYLGTMENKISESTRENLEMLAVKADEYNKTLTEVAKQELQGILSMTKDYSEHVTKHLNELDIMSQKVTEKSADNIQLIYENAQMYNQTLAEKADKHMNDIISISDQQTGAMDRASKNLAEISKELNGKLIQSLNRAFTTIDENLAEITRHLSGTISEIEETTDRVPQVVQASYAGMQTNFNEMKEKYVELVKVLDSMVHMIEKQKQQTND